MGKINSKSKYNNISNTSNIKINYRFPINSQRLLLSSLGNKKKVHFNIREFYDKQRLCMKKKSFNLGLDGVGKTDLFNRLICQNKQTSKTNVLPQPTMGYNVETIKIRCHHLCHRRSHKVTLWDCGGQSSVRSLWSYHFSNTSLLLWLINVHDRSRLNTNLQLLSQILTNPLLYRVPVLIVLYENLLNFKNENNINDKDNEQDLLTNLEVAFRFLATLSNSRASTFKWQVINVNLNDKIDDDLKKIRQSFKELMEL